MEQADIRNLKPGDTLTWHDPDKNLCTKSFEFGDCDWINKDEGTLWIVDMEHSFELECHCSELSWTKTPLEFTTLMTNICNWKKDPKEVRRVAIALMCNMLTELGYGEGVEIFVTGQIGMKVT